jgi:hypothetical protein
LLFRLDDRDRVETSGNEESQNTKKEKGRFGDFHKELLDWVWMKNEFRFCGIRGRDMKRMKEKS